jgi:tetratricopeptide (TPR) repeat protein
MQVTVAAKDFEVCEKRAKRTGLSSEERANRYFQFGVGQLESNPRSLANISKSQEKAFAAFDRAIAVDPSFLEPYITAALAKFFYGDMTGALAYLNQGLQVAPGDARLKATKAKILVSTQDWNSPQVLCDEVRRQENPGILANVLCGTVYSALEVHEKAALAFSAASGSYQPGDRYTYGSVQYEDPHYGWASATASSGNPLKAAQILTELFAKAPSHDLRPRDYVMRAEFYEKAGLYGNAADDYGKAATLPRELKSPRELRMLQVFNLSKAGLHDEARKSSNYLFEGATLQEILRMQVKLKNGSFKDLKITGKFDQPNRAALQQCVSETTCFDEIAGQRV